MGMEEPMRKNHLVTNRQRYTEWEGAALWRECSRLEQRHKPQQELHTGEDPQVPFVLSKVVTLEGLLFLFLLLFAPGPGLS